MNGLWPNGSRHSAARRADTRVPLMLTIILPPDIEALLAEEARKQGTTPESLALAGLRELFAPNPAGSPPAPTETLFDSLADFIGAVNGTTEALSESCGQHFTD